MEALVEELLTVRRRGLTRLDDATQAHRDEALTVATALLSAGPPLDGLDGWAAFVHHGW